MKVAAILGGIVLLILVVIAGMTVMRKPPVHIPACNGLECAKQSDCGKRCKCVIPAGAALGRCVS
jgi:hypothetical protein